MPGIAINPTVAAEIQRQLNYELAAAHNYLAMALWCEDQNLKGFAGHFHKQAAEEREHAEKFSAHLLARGVMPILTAIPAPTSQFDSIRAIVAQAQSMERANTEGINKTFEAALAAKDYPAQVCLHWFISEQVEEEDWTDELVERVERATCAGSLMDLDRHLEKLLAGK